MLILNMKLGQKGFTLIELLVTISILGILSVVTMSQFNTAREKARDVQRKGDLNSISKALQMYYADYGVFPEADTINNLISSEAGWVDQGYTYLAKVPHEGYDNMPNYCYSVSTDQKKYALFSAMENENDPEFRKYNGGNPYTPADPCDSSDYDYAVFSANAVYGDFD